MNNNSISYMGWLSILLTILFVGLKLCDVITWIWGWVVSPFWIYICYQVVRSIFWVIAGHIYEKYGENENEQSEK